MKKRVQYKIGKLKLPLGKMTSREQHYVGVVLESVHEDFKIFGESLDIVKRDVAAVKKKGDATFEEVGKIKVRLVMIDSRLDSIEKVRLPAIDSRLDGIEKVRLPAIDSRLDGIEKELKSIKNEIQELRLSLTRKADVERLEALELKVAALEKTLAERR